MDSNHFVLLLGSVQGSREKRKSEKKEKEEEIIISNEIKYPQPFLT